MPGDRGTGNEAAELLAQAREAWFEAAFRPEYGHEDDYKHEHAYEIEYGVGYGIGYRNGYEAGHEADFEDAAAAEEEELFRSALTLDEAAGDKACAAATLFGLGLGLADSRPLTTVADGWPVEHGCRLPTTDRRLPARGSRLLTTDHGDCRFPARGSWPFVPCPSTLPLDPCPLPLTPRSSTFDPRPSTLDRRNAYRALTPRLESSRMTERRSAKRWARQTMRKTIGTAAAGAVLCVLALAGCAGGSHGAASGSGAGAATATTAPAGDSGAQSSGANGVPAGTPTDPAAVDSELNSVDQQLGVAGSDLAQATASPSDGD
jgi:hypothetical protein